MNIQTLFNRMMLYDNELSLIDATGDDFLRGITAVNLVQDWWEAVAAAISGLCKTKNTIDTTANQETTDWPLTLARIDKVWLLDAAGNQVREVTPIHEEGGHIPDLPYPVSAVSLSGVMNTGAPFQYAYDGPGGQLYWSPKPDAVYTLRVFGLWTKADYASADDEFLYPDVVALAIPPFAVQVMRLGLDRDLEAIQRSAEGAFARAVKALKRPVQSEPLAREYSEIHDT